MRSLKQLVLFVTNVYRTPPVSKQSDRESKGNKKDKKTLEIVREIGVQIKLRARQGPGTK